MSWLPKDLYPPGSGIDSKLIEDIVMGDIIKHEIRRSEQVAAILTKVMLVAQQEEDASSSVCTVKTLTGFFVWMRHNYGN
jgi:hypothetical protein